MVDRSPTLLALALTGLLLGSAACGVTAQRRDGPVTQPDRPATPTEDPRTSQTTPEVRPAAGSTPQSRALWQDAEALEIRGAEVAAHRVLERLVREAPSTPEASRARVRLAERALSHGAWKTAEALSAPADALLPEGVWRFRRLKARALAYEGQERWREASTTWLAAADAGAPPEAGREATDGAARSLFLAGSPEEAAEALPEERRGELEAVVEPALTGDVLTRLYGELPDGNPWKAWVALKLARERWQAGEIEGAAEAALTVRAETRDPAVRAEADALLAKVAAWRQVEPRTLGVLLPLSGPHEGLGRAALEGLKLAIGPDSGLTLVLRDTKGDAAEAARQAESLVLDAHVAAVLGPVGHLESAAVAQVTARFGVPHVLLTSDHGVGAGGPWIIRSRLSPEEQAAALARFAVTTMGVQRVGILYPEGVLGETLMAAFFEEIVRLGGEVRAVEAYRKGGPKGGEDVQKAVSRLVAASRPGGGTVDFEAVFVPDDAREVKRVVPFLDAWGMLVKTSPHVTGTSKRPAVQLLGSSGWNDPLVIDPAQRLTENAVFVAPFFHDPDDPRSDRFARAFFARYKRKPAAFHAEVHDAAALAARALGAPIAAPDARRAEVLAALRGIRNLEGATGLLTVLADGMVVKRPRLLTVHGDELRPRLTEEEEAALRQPTGPVGPR